MRLHEKYGDLSAYVFGSIAAYNMPPQVQSALIVLLITFISRVGMKLIDRIINKLFPSHITKVSTTIITRPDSEPPEVKTNIKEVH